MIFGANDIHIVVIGFLQLEIAYYDRKYCVRAKIYAFVQVGFVKSGKGETI